MTFNKHRLFSLIVPVLLCFPHCGLRIGEPAPSLPMHRLLPSADYCSNLDYREEFASYFLKEQAENLEDNTVGEKWSRVLDCIRLKTLKTNDLIKNEQIEKKEFINLLNQDFVRTEDMAPIIDNIAHPDYFDHYIFIKSALIRLMKRSSDRLSSSSICQKPEDQSVFSKHEIQVFLDFLEDLSDFFLVLETASYEVMELFFKQNESGGPSGQISPDVFDSFFKQADLNARSFSAYPGVLYFKNHFIPFLSDYLRESFPEYSKFLNPPASIPEVQKINIGSIIPAGWISFLNKEALQTGENLSGDPASRTSYLDEESKDKILQSFMDMAVLPYHYSDRFTVQNVKYMMLNVYVMQAVFSVYDVNGDSVLNPEEIEPLSCVITPFVSVVSSAKLKGKWDIIRRFYDPKAVAGYIIHHQKIPSGGFDLSFLIHRLLEDPEEMESLSYADVSRLTALFLSELFKKIQDNFQKNL